MKLIYSIFILVLFGLSLKGQEEKSFYQSGREYLLKRDYDNAIISLRTDLLSTNNINAQKDLLWCYYYKNAFDQVDIEIKKLTKRKDADEVSFYISSYIYMLTDNKIDARSIAKKGLKKFPKSGKLYNIIGQVFMEEKKALKAIKYWEKGIKLEPNIAENYYDAATFYAETPEFIWTLVYGEVFVNFDKYSPKTKKMKQLLWNCYKERLFQIYNNNLSSKRKKNHFALSVEKLYTKNFDKINRGINLSSLTNLREAFILHWMESKQDEYPFKLFKLLHNYILQGHFEVYNQWLFGEVSDKEKFTAWKKKNITIFNNFLSFQKSRVFKAASHQYYH